MSKLDLEDGQRQFCRVHGSQFVPACGQDIAGLALGTIGLNPINGLRHPTSAGTTGWYVWCGESLSESPDFFHPICTDHLIEKLPSVARFLGLKPGYRFLIVDSYEDVWFDEALLKV